MPFRKPPFDFVLDYLQAKTIRVKPMFGLWAVYVSEKIVLILRNRKVNPELNGVWVATTAAHHQSLKRALPILRSITTESDDWKETEWQLIPGDSDEFEEAVRQVCDWIVHDDPRIGRIPK
jgi:hypothetical protein